MASNWPRVRVSDVCELIVDCVNKTAPVSPVPTPYKMIRTPNIKNGRVSTDDCRCVDADTFAKWTRRATVERNDVLLTREAPLGEVGIVNSSEQLFLGQRIMQYRADQSKLDPHFLLYSFLSPDLQHQFSMHEGSGSVVSHIRVGDCSKFELNLPPLAMQKRISEILRNLDNRITLNRQINQTLEQMAQTLFKSWFVDFDPVMDNALDAGNPIPDELQHRAEARKAVRESEGFNPLPDDVRQLFPDAFEESELGWVPKGWSYSELGSLTDFATGPVFKSSDFVPEGIRLARGDNVKEGYFHWGDKARYWSEITPKLEKYLLQANDILLGMDGSKVGKNWCKVTPSDLPCLLVQRVARLRETSKIGASMLEVIISGSSFKKYVDNVKTGTSIPHISGKQIKEFEVLMPPFTSGIVECFEKLMQPIAQRRLASTGEIISLTSLRDTLLPKLISGELRLDDVETAVEQETVSA
ncbi:TPA: restriction endonuclease subunit S [Vibrio vulnificus]|nr:restriction endonuclease subunit S [Vibrio vulnificus]